MSPSKLSLIGLMFLACMAMSMADPFANSKWTIKVSPDDDARKAGEKEYQDTITFAGNTFASTTLTARGFKPAQFNADVRPLGMAKFAVTQTSDKEGTAMWDGMLTSPTISGMLTFTHKDGTKRVFKFAGERAEH